MIKIIFLLILLFTLFLIIPSLVKNYIKSMELSKRDIIPEKYIKLYEDYPSDFDDMNLREEKILPKFLNYKDNNRPIYWNYYPEVNYL